MVLIDEVRARLDDREVIIATAVEAVNVSDVPATAVSVAAIIGGAPINGVAYVLDCLVRKGVCSRPSDRSYLLTSLGAEVLKVEVPGWEPNSHQQRRREAEELVASRTRA